MLKHITQYYHLSLRILQPMWFSTSAAAPPNTSLVKAKPNQQLTKHVDKHRRKHKTGPQLLITKILMLNGPLKSKEIWRYYSRLVKLEKGKEGEQDINYFPSLTKLKLTLKFMRTNGKIKSNGYNRKDKEFLGWKIDEVRALKFVHPDVAEDIHDQVRRKDEL